MPCAGNHENELGNGRLGYLAYQTRFALPSNGEADPAWQGMWYTFKTGSVRVISLNNDDVCCQDAGDDEETDWIVVCMHQVAISSARGCNGADLGIRQEWLPLFDKYGVDLVVCGHEHHYERSKSIRGVDRGSPTLRPDSVDDRLDVIDTTNGTVHMVIGGGGTSATSNHLFSNPAVCDVIVSASTQSPVAPDEPRPRRVATKVTEAATWVGRRNTQHSYGFAAVVKMPGLGVPGSNAWVDVQATRTAWGLTVLQSAPDRENAIKFLQLLLAPGEIGQATLQKVGPAPISPAVVSADDFRQVPPELRNLLTTSAPLGA